MRCSWSVRSLAEIGFELLQPVAVLFRLAEQVGHLPFERVEPLVERHDRRLGRGGLVGKPAVSAGRPFGKTCRCISFDLPLEPIDPLLGRRRLALRKRRSTGTSAMAATRRESGDRTE